eukprot:5511648-Amphidinium_carterae.1
MPRPWIDICRCSDLQLQSWLGALLETREKCCVNCLDHIPYAMNQVQFHALALLYELKKTDRLALHKVGASLQQPWRVSQIMTGLDT